MFGMGLRTSDSILEPHPPLFFSFHNSPPFWSGSQLIREMWSKFKELAPLLPVVLIAFTDPQCDTPRSYFFIFFSKSLILTRHDFRFSFFFSFIFSFSFSFLVDHSLQFFFDFSVLRGSFDWWLVVVNIHLKLMKKCSACGRLLW